MSQLVECHIKIISGPHQGETYQMVSNQLTVGRSQTNDIVLKKDSKVSRTHIKIFFYKNQFWIEKLTHHNFLYVNQKQVTSQVLENRSMIHIGTSKIQFIFELKNPVTTEEKQDVMKKKSPKLFLPIALLGSFILAFVLFSGKKSPKKLSDMQTEISKKEQVLNLERKVKEKSNLIQRRRISSKESVYSRKNQISGFRYYQQGQFVKALKAFEGCLSIDPNHTNCRIYREMSETKINQLIGIYLRNAKQHYKQKQYSYCIATLNNAMSLMTTKGPLYKEAESQKEICSMEKEILKR